MVLNYEGQMQIQIGDALQPMTSTITFPGEIVIKTNGTFKVGQGKERKLERSQAITVQGMLYKPDGTLVPVFDHYFANHNLIYLVKDGGEPLLINENVVFADGTYLRPDAFYHSPRRNLRRLIDGHTIALDGRIITSLDTVTFKEGKVTVQKDGALLRVTSSITMNDGTKVLADGTMISFDKTKTIKLREGETIVLPGPALRE
jgi:hypothetical protein